ncbi:hypothetical protein GYH30_010094 [Glycine max]|uniref:BZIP domain-containing protein n=1 Tax=Glycine max TaxID=3847 RepID=K7KKE0_SOYBN|nr:hypothetical protein GYH30_010094 [Glycine max]
MEGNDANRLHGPPNYATLTPQHCTQNFTLNNETIEGHQRHRDRILTHVDSSQVFNSIFPLYYSKLHLSNNTNSPNTSSNSNNNNTNADEANALLEDRTQKRMFFNRESARRSRMQRKQQIETPFSTLDRQLSEKIIYLLECNQQILEHNAQLKDNVSSLQVNFTLIC